MPRHAQLPPRCPLPKKNTTCPANNVGTILVEEEQPEWLNDLLSDSESNSNVINHSQASNDSLTLLDGLDQVDDTETLDSSEPDDDGSFEPSCAYGPNSPRTKNEIVSAFLNGQVNDIETLDFSEPDDDDRSFESSCAYGPNSPRMKNKPGFPENKIASAFSEYVVQSSLQRSDSLEDDCASVGVFSNMSNAMKRQHGQQRSRVRKVQYIAELEKTVDILQNIGSELEVRVASLLQQRVALTMENNTMKQQLLRMQQQKFAVDDEYRSLTEELLRLKNNLAFSHNKKVPNWSHAPRFSHSDDIWEMDKLNLN